MYCILQRNNKNVPLHCNQCILETSLGNPEDAHKIYKILEKDENDVVDIPLDIPTELFEKYPDLQKIINKILYNSIIAVGRYNASKITNISSLFMGTFSTHNMDCFEDLKILEIKPSEIFHHDVNPCFIHVSDEYEVIKTWSFNVEFIEYLLQEDLMIELCGYDLMTMSIMIGSLEVIDYLIDVGVDINHQQDFSMLSFQNYVELAAIKGIHVLKHVLSHGCRPIVSIIGTCNIQGVLDEIMPYFKIDEMSPDEKYDLAVYLILNMDLEIIQCFEKQGLMITNEILDHIQDDDYLAYSPIHHKTVKYLLSLGISAKFFYGSYEEALIYDKLERMEILEKAGIFEHYEPARFLNAAAKRDSKILQHILDLGIDMNQEQLRAAFVRASPYNFENMMKLEPYIETLDLKLMNDALHQINDMQRRMNLDRRGIDYLLDHEAEPSDFLLYSLALNDLQMLKILLEKRPEIDVMMEMPNNLSKAYIDNTIIGSSFNASNLLNIAIFFNHDSDFASTLEMMLKRPCMDPDRLASVFERNFQAIVDCGNRGLRPDLALKAQFLAQHGYLSSAIADTLAAQFVVGNHDICVSDDEGTWKSDCEEDDLQQN